MPLICGVGGQSAAAQRYIGTANGPKMPSPGRGWQALFRFGRYRTYKSYWTYWLARSTR